MLHMCDLFFIFNPFFIVINNLITTDALIFVYFLENLLVLEDSLIKANNFQKAKVQSQGFA